jgi:hypothetical protein
VPGSPALAQDLAATAAETELSQADVIRQSLKLGLLVLRARLGKSPQRRLSLVKHFNRLLKNGKNFEHIFDSSV